MRESVASGASSPCPRRFVLREIDLFQDLSDADVEEIGRSAPMRTVAAGSTLYSPLSPTDVLFILKAGRVKLYSVAHDGRTLTTAIVDPGEVFGEMPVMGQRLGDSWADVVEDAVICLMSPVDVDRLLLSDPRIARRVAELMGRRVSELEGRLTDAVLGSAADRIVRTIARLDRGGPIRLTHQQLADVAGSTRATTTKVVGRLVADGVIRSRRGAFVVKDRRSLDELSRRGGLALSRSTPAIWV